MWRGRGRKLAGAAAGFCHHFFEAGGLWNGCICFPATGTKGFDERRIMFIGSSISWGRCGDYFAGAVFLQKR